MSATSAPTPDYVVLDSSFVIALCTKEPTRISHAVRYLESRAKLGCTFYSPGVCVSESLSVFCLKLQKSEITAKEHQEAVANFEDLAKSITPSPKGDFVFIGRADKLRSQLGCSTSADAIYAALAEELAKSGPTEIATCDQDMSKRTASALAPISIELIP